MGGRGAEGGARGPGLCGEGGSGEKTRKRGLRKGGRGRGVAGARRGAPGGREGRKGREEVEGGEARMAGGWEEREYKARVWGGGLGVRWVVG